MDQVALDIEADDDDDEDYQPPRSKKKRTQARRGVTAVDAALDARILISTQFCPKEFNRRMSPVSKCANWKAVETRQFMLYLAYNVFEDMLERADAKELISMIQFYLYLICGTAHKPIPDEDLKIAEILAVRYNALLRLMQGTGNLPTAHNAIHIPQDCRFFECQAECNSTFKFENDMTPVRRMVTGGFGKLSQIRTRVLEKQRLVFAKDADNNIVRMSSGDPLMGDTLLPQHVEAFHAALQSKSGTVTVKRKDLKCISFPHFELHCSGFRNSFCLMKVAEGKYEIVRCIDALRRMLPGGGEEVHVVGIRYRKMDNLFTKPYPSMVKHVYVFSNPTPEHVPRSSWPITQIAGKLYVSPRFSTIANLPDSVHLRSESLAMCHLGTEEDSYCNVKEWVGVLLRHSSAEEAGSSLY